jgi:lysophosphatidylcholine acyltransferase / lyso-PAF acetyltransferase
LSLTPSFARLNSPIARLSPVSKAENANMVFMGDILKVLRSVIVDRTSAQSRSDTAAALTERAKSRKWPQILLFPEGTTTNGTCLAQFQLGAFLAGQPIQPVVVTYDGQDIDASLVDDGPDVFPSIFRFMCFLRHPVRACSCLSVAAAYFLAC